MKTFLRAARIITPVEVIDDGVVLIDEDRIGTVAPRSEVSVHLRAHVVDLGDSILAPAFLDIHMHGAAGQDVMSGDLDAVERMIVNYGVTAYYPTTVTAPLDDTLRALDRLGKAIDKAVEHDSARPGRARPLGIHLEGPFISHEQRGVHPPASILEPSLEVFERYWQASRGHIKLMTTAPELPHATELIREATRRGVCVSIGHSNAGTAAALAGVEAGARHATHTFNAMRPLDHRNRGVLGVVLTDDRLSADIIADGIHVEGPVVDLFLRAKGRERAVLITDAMSAMGMPPGRYRLGTFDVDVNEGRCLFEGRLAGSVLTLDRAVQNVMRFANFPLQDAVRLATLNPAHLLGLDQDEAHLCRGLLKPGAAADLVVLSPAGEVRQTIIGGRVGGA